MPSRTVCTIAGLLASTLIATACGANSSGKALTLTNSPAASGAKTRVWAFSDAKLVQPAGEYASELAARKADLCTTAEEGSAPVSLDQAITTLDGVLTRAGGPGSLDKLARTRVGSDPAQAETVAVAEVGKANPGGALAALLLAHKAQPNDPRHLENAGVMAAAVGYPAEGLALLTAAEGLPSNIDPGMGLDFGAMELSNRAYALILLGRYGEAIPLLKTAIGREPLLDEAQRNLAVALLCQGQGDEAGQAMRAGERRNQFQDLGDPTRPQSFDPSQAFDLSKGQPTKLPDVTYPLTLDQDAGAADKFESDWSNRSGQARQALDQEFALSPNGHLNPLSIRRISYIEQLSGKPSGTAQLAQLFNAWQDAYKAGDDMQKAWLDTTASQNTACSAPGIDFTSCFNSWCTSAAPEAQRKWYPAMQHEDAAMRAWADAYSRYASGLASNLRDPSAHQWVLLEETYELMSNYALTLQQASVWISGMASYKGTCYDQITPSPAEGNTGGKASAASCSSLIGGANISIDLELFTISINCEEVGIEAEAPALEGGFAEAGIFASVSYKFHNGSTTVFAGDYAKTREIGGLSASAHGGGYVTFDTRGNVTDCGVKGETSIDQSSGQVSSSVSGPEAHFSFMGAADSAD